MEDQPEHHAEEVKSLQRCMNDLVSMLALPAMWSGGNATQIVHTLTDALLGMLRLDFIYVRLNDPARDADLEVARVGRTQNSTAQPSEISAVLQRWLKEDLQKWPSVIVGPVGGGNISIVPLRLGLHDEVGLIVAGSQRADFPQQAERLLLTVAANQAALALQEARLLSGQKDVTSQLDQRVAQRTAELATANDELRKEIAERKLAEALLRQREESFRTIVETTPECVKILARDGKVLQVNSAGVAMAGAPSADVVIGLNFYDFLVPEYRDSYREFHERVCAGQKGFLQFEIITARGERRYMETHAAPLRNNDGSVGQLGVTRDITDRKQSEEKLRRNELNARLIVDSIPGLVAVMTPVGEIEYFNRQFLEYFGRTQEELEKWKTSHFVHPNDLSRVVETREKSLATGHSYDVEYRIRRFDGEYRWFQARGLPLADPNGSIVRWYVLLSDIDERKRAEQALRASEGNFRKIINTLPTTAWSTRPDGYCDFLSHRWLDYAGFSAEQAEGWGWGSVIHPDDAPGLTEHWQSCLASGAPVDAEARMRRFDGTYRWFLFRANPLRDESGAIVEWFGTNIDIEDRKRAEEKLRRSEAFLAKAQRLSLTGSFSYYSESGEFTWSEELYRIYELQPDVHVTLSLIGSRYHPEDAHLVEEVAAGIRRGDPDFDYEHRLLMPNGSIKHIRVVAQGSPNEDGSGLEYFGAVQDLTQRREAEAALDKARSDLAHVTRVMSLGALTASIAHEVNQPLSGIITNASTCLRMLAADPPNVDGARETARRTIRDGNRAADVIARLRSLFTKREAATETVDLNDAAREVIALLSSDLQRNRVILVVELDDDLPAVAGDRVQLQQVIMNLLRNASDAMSGIDDRPRTLVIKTEQEEHDGVRLAVRDAGVGFDLQHVERLFDTFYTTKSSGMGVGLPVSRTIVESHGGKLWAELNDGPGATFSFSIPGSPESLTDSNISNVAWKQASTGAPHDGRNAW